MPTIVYSVLDPAGKNIADRLREEFGFAPAAPIAGRPAWSNGRFSLVEISDRTVTADYLDELKADLIVFASRHKSQSGRPTLTAHACGNWNERAEFGGVPRTLAPTNAHAIAAALRSYAGNEAVRTGALSGFEVIMECTHHGPLLATPFLFVEIGSSEKEWGIPEAGKAAAEACLAACAAGSEGSVGVSGGAGERVAIGIGGIHYPHEISKEVLRPGSATAVGHVCPKYAFEFLDDGMLRQMIAKSGGHVDLALIDWKSLKAAERTKALELLKAFNLPYEKV